MDPTNNNASNATSSGGSRPSGNTVTSKRSPLQGAAYHIRLTMIILFRAFALHRQGKLPQFELKMEVPDAGKFDDLVFRYSSPTIPEGTVYIQAKHKYPSEKPRKSKKIHPNHPYTPTRKERPAITEGTLLTKWNSNGPFSIAKYFISYLEGYERSITGSHTYLLCTNATIDNKLKQKLTLRPQDSSEILSFCDVIGATCYSFSSEEQFHALTDALRQASLEKLGQMLVLHVRYNTEIKSNYSSLNVFVDLIAVCVEELEGGTGKFKLSHRLLTACETSIMGKLRAVLKKEYDRLIRAKQCDNSCVSWEEMQFMIDKSFFQTKGPPTSTHDESFFFDQVNRVIKRFYKEFMLVCGSLNGDQLHNSVLEIMPHWVDDRKTTHNIMFMRLFDSMSLPQPIPMDLNYLKQQFISMKVNYNFSRFQIESQCDLSRWQYMYRYIVVRSDRLQHTELYEFLSGKTTYERYQYYTTLDIVLYSLVASQTVALLQCNALFIHYAASDFEEDIRDVLRGLFEFFAEVDPISYTIIMTIEQSKKSILPEIQRYAKEYKIKFIVIEEVLKALPDEECFYVRDLTEKARQKLYAKYCKTTLNLFGTTISLSGIVNDDDGLSFVCKFLYNYYELDHIKYIESKEQNFEAIKPRYISRTVNPYVGENAKDSEVEENNFYFTYRVEFQKIFLDNIRFNSDEFSQMVASVSSANDDVQYTIPDVFKHHDETKVHLLLDEAGAGKSTYFTWLTHALSIDDPSQYVIQMNASQYCTDYKRWQKSDIKLLDDTAIVRFLYRLIHLTHFVPNVYSFSIESTDVFRDQADHAAELLTLVNGTLYVNTCKTKTLELTFAQLIELKVFQQKFNQKQLIILFDGLDETAPFYKEFVVHFFRRLASLDGIRALFISTRPYDYMEQLKSTFSNCRMHYLTLLSQHDQLQFVHNYLMQELEGYKQCDSSKRDKVLGYLYRQIVEYLGNLKRIPLFLNMACIINLPIAQKNMDLRRFTIPEAMLYKANVDLLSLIENFINQKLRILCSHKNGLPEYILDYPHQKAINEKFWDKIKKRHILLAMVVMFDQKQREVLLTSNETIQINKFIKEVREGIEKTGIIKQIHDETPQFTHRIFAEYFAACWMNDNKNRMRSESFFHSWSYWKPQLHQMRDLFNRIVLRVSKENDLHMAVVNQSLGLVREILTIIHQLHW
ncbi:uncharacterized protein LOC121599036 [Anopheles merus]|uniref:uncharacterized protein LOC121599036 n=1 Tax=Anopheles merus TaxID=30066 RepID=UPI001BE44848|nr:uncharacterized protein LOC121599036 [Anopheles merus]